eukprot:127866-Amphidinium_carterae.1
MCNPNKVRKHTCAVPRAWDGGGFWHGAEWQPVAIAAQVPEFSSRPPNLQGGIALGYRAQSCQPQKEGRREGRSTCELVV